MHKEKVLGMIKKLETKRDSLTAKSNASEDLAEVRGINTQLVSTNEDLAELREMLEEIEAEEERAAKDNPEGQGGVDTSWQKNDGEQRNVVPPVTTEGAVNRAQVMGSYGMGAANQGNQDEAVNREAIWDKRGEDLKEKRSVTFEIEEMPELRAVMVGDGNIVMEKHTSKTIRPTFNEVSKLIDAVHVENLPGGESYTVPFEVTVGEGDNTAEGVAAHDSDPVFDYAVITKGKITAYAEISEEVAKLTNAKYQSKVQASVSKAVRKKASKQILVGKSGVDAILGIFEAPANVIPVASDLEIVDIDEYTLDDIVIGYGGDEDVEGEGFLVLNKIDLAAFAKVTADGKRFYKIKRKGNMGYISSESSFEVPFIINSICSTLSAAGTVAGTHCMAYGMMDAYELAYFSPIVVQESRDYKFKEGMIAYRAVVHVGGNTTMYKGFTRIKKKAAV